MTTPHLRPVVEACPGCNQIEGVKQADQRHGPRGGVALPRCGMSWAITVVNPKPPPAYLADLGAAAEEIRRLRWTLRQIITLAADAPQLADEQLRARLLALAESCAR